MAEIKQNNEAIFMAWLSTKVSPTQLSELYIAFQEIEQQAKKAKNIKQSLYENVDVVVFKKIRSNIEQSKVFKITHKRQMGRINSALNYLLQYAQDGASSAEVQISTLKESKSSEKGSKISVTAPKQIEECLGVQMIDLTAIPDMAFTKPVELSYFGNEIQENSWRTVYADLCKQLIDDYPEILKQLRKDSMSGKTKVWLVDDAHTELPYRNKLQCP